MFFICRRRKLYIADARPRKNALANGAMGGGSESSANYFQSEVCLIFELSGYAAVSVIILHVFHYTWTHFLF